MCVVSVEQVFMYCYSILLDVYVLFLVHSASGSTLYVYLIYIDAGNINSQLLTQAPTPRQYLSGQHDNSIF